MLLKEKHEKFCQNYILHRNATRAAKDAGYSEVSAHNTGSRLLQDTAIQERIEELNREHFEGQQDKLCECGNIIEQFDEGDDTMECCEDCR